MCHIPAPFSHSFECLGEVRGEGSRLGSLMTEKMRGSPTETGES